MLSCAICWLSQSLLLLLLLYLGFCLVLLSPDLHVCTALSEML
jgi:hypothetical protein